ncbi:hypothetical protein LINGRAHAP2_LOCUS18367 [Linum grandiflorum]
MKMSSSVSALLLVIAAATATVTLLSHASTSHPATVVVAEEIDAIAPSRPNIKLGPTRNDNVKESNIDPESKNVKGSDEHQKKNGESKHVVGGRKSMKFPSAAVGDQTSTASSSFKTSKHHYSNGDRDLVAFTSDYRSPRHHPPKNN